MANKSNPSSPNFISPQSNCRPPITYILLIVGIACAVAILHRCQLAYMFESDRHFSHLSTLERELTFRTEMGLYYSYYKTLVETPSLAAGINLIINDNKTEYGDTINTLYRFNLYPELLLSVTYRIYMSAMNTLGLPTAQCWKVRRGPGQDPVVSCEGLGEPAYFYIEGAFLLNGLLAGVYFLFGVYLSENVAGGFLTVLGLAYNHRECTRVQWTPPLRESFAYPFFVLHFFAVTAILKVARPRFVDSFVIVAMTTTCFMLPWQFAQFALLTTTLAVFATYLLRFIDARKLKLIAGAQIVGVTMGIVLLFFNRMIITSYHFSSLLACLLIASTDSYINRSLRGRFVVGVVVRVLILLLVSVTIKAVLTMLLGVSDDEHIFDLIRSKLTSFRTFHTMLYTCAAEFDFMQFETIVSLTKTLLLPSSIAAVLIVIYNVICNLWNNTTCAAGTMSTLGSGEQIKCKTTSAEGLTIAGTPVENPVNKSLKAEFQEVNNSGDAAPANNAQDINISGKRLNDSGTVEHAELVYSVFQLGAFTVMAVYFMRLKLFWTPHLCLMTSLLASRRLFLRICSRRNQLMALSVLVALMSVEGIRNIQAELDISGEFDGSDAEDLVRWINDNTAPDASFAGAMPTMATVKLCTGRPIVNHPHYEDAGLRNRSKRVYSLFSRKPASEVWQTLREMRVDYAIIEQSWCVGKSRTGCAMADLWDHEDVENRGRRTLCERLYANPAPYFKRVFHTPVYSVLQLVAVPIEESHDTF